MRDYSVYRDLESLRDCAEDARQLGRSAYADFDRR